MNRLTSATQAARATGGWTASTRPDLDRTFRAAARHSRWVRRLRIAVPVAVVVMLVVASLATWLNPLRLLAKLPNAGGTLVISGTKITMELPRLAGYTRDARAYELTAKTADQDITHPDSVELKGIHAKVQTEDKGVVELIADDGFYNTKAEQLKLGDGVVLTSTTGYEVRLKQALVDMQNGHIVSEQPVEVKMLNGALSAARLEVVDSGELLRFDGGVAMTVMLGSANQARSAASPPPNGASAQ